MLRGIFIGFGRYTTGSLYAGENFVGLSSPFGNTPLMRSGNRLADGYLNSRNSDGLTSSSSVISSNSTMKEYNGRNNNLLPNDRDDRPLQLFISKGMNQLYKCTYIVL